MPITWGNCVKFVHLSWGASYQGSTLPALELSSTLPNVLQNFIFLQKNIICVQLTETLQITRQLKSKNRLLSIFCWPTRGLKNTVAFSLDHCLVAFNDSGRYWRKQPWGLECKQLPLFLRLLRVQFTIWQARKYDLWTACSKAIGNNGEAWEEY